MTRKVIHAFGRELTIDNGQLAVKRTTIDTSRPGDYGADPIGDGTFRMIPSGDIVDYAERCKRLAGSQAK